MITIAMLLSLTWVILLLNKMCLPAMDLMYVQPPGRVLCSQSRGRVCV